MTCQCLPVESNPIENERAGEPVKVHEEGFDSEPGILHDVQDCPFPQLIEYKNVLEVFCMFTFVLQFAAA